jgi:propionyl-CoA carboxylase beta chain
MPTSDKPDRECPELEKILPDKPSKSYDMKRIILEIADNHEMLEPHAIWAKNMIVTFIRIMGCPVGVVANNPRFGAGVLDVSASDKAARFIRFCDAFNIPLLTLADVPGYLPGTRQEWAGIISHGAKMLHAYSEATVPKLTIVIRKDYGGAYIGMCSKQLGADYVMAWPSAEIAVMGAEAPATSFTGGKFRTHPTMKPSAKNLPRPMKPNSTTRILRQVWESSTRSSDRETHANGWLFCWMH